MTAVRPICKGRLIAVFGAGGDRDRTKRPIMGEIASRLADNVIVTSDNPRTEEPMAIISEILPGVQKHDSTASRPTAARRYTRGWTWPAKTTSS